MLDPGGDEVARDALAKEAKAQIEAKGTLKLENKWGLRKMAYEIDQRTEADYRWFRFEAPTELLDGLNHSLRITDGVLRFRIFKVDADTPTIAPPSSAAPGPGASRDRPAPDAAPAAAEPTPEATEAPPESAEPAPATEPAPEPAPVATEPAPDPAPAPVAAEEPAGDAADSDE